MMNILDAYAFDFLTDCVDLIDRRVAQLEAEAEASDDPDGHGVFDRLEYVIGFGFVACQQYVTTVCSNHKLSKKQALVLGPQHRTRVPIVKIVNAAANYWKHSPEWESANRGGRIRDLFELVGGGPSGDYPVGSLLSHLLTPLPARFERLVPFLDGWTCEIERAPGAP